MDGSPGGVKYGANKEPFSQYPNIEDGVFSCLHETPEESRIGKLTDCSSADTKK